MKMMLKPLKYKDIDHIDVETKFEICGTSRMESATTVTAVGYGVTVNQILEELSRWGVEHGYAERKDSDKPEKVILNDPATVVFFKDGTKAVAKAKDGDEYDPLFGIMACALRKTGKNRVRIDEWEPVIDFLSSYIADAKECRAIADMLNTTADALELDGVMDAIEDFDEREYDPIAEMDRVVSEALERLEEILDEIGEEDG